MAFSALPHPLNVAATLAQVGRAVADQEGACMPGRVAGSMRGLAGASTLGQAEGYTKVPEAACMPAPVGACMRVLEAVYMRGRAAGYTRDPESRMGTKGLGDRA